MKEQLLNAAKNGDDKTLSSLLNSSENKKLVDVTDDTYGCTLLAWAIIQGHETTAKLLLTLNANPCLVSKQGRNALHFACRDGRLEIVKILLERFSQLKNSQDEDGMTSLHLAIRESKIDIVNLMLTYDIDIEIKNKKGETILDITREKNSPEITEILNKKLRKSLKTETMDIVRKIEVITESTGNLSLSSSKQELPLKTESDFIEEKNITSQLENEDLTPFFPRCEFHTRFEHTTIFEMNDPEYWGTYYRSQDSRVFKTLGKKDGLYSSPGISRTDGFSPYAHTGGHTSPFKSPVYSNSIKQHANNPQLSKYKEDMRDQILEYKIRMCKIVQDSFTKHNGFNIQPARVFRTRSPKETRPIVFLENEYSCVLVRMPIFNKDVHVEDEATKYWLEHPQPLQKLIVACFVAIMNTQAFKKGIPIEMVMRAGFGHNLPSVDETGNTFRINVGLIPTAYAELIGESLCNLYKLMESISDSTSKEFKISKSLDSSINSYNKTRKSEIKFEGKIWQVIRQSAHAGKKSLLSELLIRNQFCAELFTDYIMETLSHPGTEISQNIIDDALQKMINLIRYDETVTMQEAKNLVSINKKKWPEKLLTSHDDKSFNDLVRNLCDSLLFDSPEEGKLLGLYAHLDRANLHFFSSRCNDPAEDGYGSDSEFEYEENEAKQKIRFHGKKLRLQTGMKAISVAYYAAQLYLKEKNIGKFSVNTEYMYYETPDMIKLGEVIPGLKKEQDFTFEWYDKAEPKKKAERKPKDKVILFYDLNHFNKENRLDGNKALHSRLEIAPAVVVLDYTSSTYQQVREAISECLRENEIVFLAGAGIKHDQGGADINPYGELRIVAKNREFLNKIYTGVISALNGLNNEYTRANAVPATAHRIVKGYKKRGHAFTFFGLYPNAFKPTATEIKGDTEIRSQSAMVEKKEGSGRVKQRGGRLKDEFELVAQKMGDLSVSEPQDNPLKRTNFSQQNLMSVPKTFSQGKEHGDNQNYEEEEKKPNDDKNYEMMGPKG